MDNNILNCWYSAGDFFPCTQEKWYNFQGKLWENSGNFVEKGLWQPCAVVVVVVVVV